MVTGSVRAGHLEEMTLPPSEGGCRDPHGCTWRAETQVKAGICPWHQLAGAPIWTAPSRAGSFLERTVGTLLACRAEAPEGAQDVMAGGAFRAEALVQEALLDIVLTGVALQAWWAAALDLGVGGQTLASAGAQAG